MKKATINNFFRKFGFELHGNGYIQSLKKNEFKEDAFEVQSRMVSDVPKVIFDLGANRGDTAMKYASLFTEATIHAFEPFSDSYEKLKKATNSNNRIKIHQLAITDKQGESVLFSNINEDTNSLLKSSKIGLSSDEQVRNIGQVAIQTNTLDNFCKEHQINNIDILKMDIQGSELSALKGAFNLLKEKKIRMIYTETYFRKQYENQPLFNEIATYMETFGYHVQDFYTPIYGKGSIIWCDVIFLPE